MPALPDIHAIAVILLTGLTLYLFAKEQIPLETTGFLVLIRRSTGIGASAYTSVIQGAIRQNTYIGIAAHSVPQPFSSPPSPSPPPTKL